MPRDFFARVYLNLKKGVSIPVRQLAVSSEGLEAVGAGLMRTVVSGVYAPAVDEQIISFRGAPLRPGTLVSLRASDVQYVTVDPPPADYDKFVDTMAFALRDIRGPARSPALQLHCPAQGGVSTSGQLHPCLFEAH